MRRRAAGLAARVRTTAFALTLAGTALCSACSEATPPDTEPPTLLSVSLAAAAGGADELEVSLVARDRGGVHSVRMTVRQPTGTEGSCNGARTNQSGRESTWTCRFPLADVGGEWEVVAVELTDAAGNRRTYAGSELPASRYDDCRPIVASLAITPAQPRALGFAGDTLHLAAAARNACGQPVTQAAIGWSSSDGLVAVVADGKVTALRAGVAWVRASSGLAVDSVRVVVATAAPSSHYEIVGLGIAGGITSDLWVSGDYAYTGTTFSGGISCPGSPACSANLYTWRVANPGAPVLVDSLRVNAPSIGDLMVSPETGLGFLALQASPAGNGVLILDLSDPSHPTVLRHYATGLEQGVHTLWVSRIAGRDYVFAVENGSNPQGGTHIIEVSNPTSPVEVGHFYGGSSFSHDIEVRDGLAFLCHWDAGLIILDVGNGLRGGSPANPVEVGRITTGLRSVHNVSYWPARQLAFVGEERENGRLQVIDLANGSGPSIVAYAEIPGGTPHNFWLDEEAQVLHAAWYEHGIRAFDVSGALRGDLRAQGLEIGSVVPEGPRGPASIWGTHLQRGFLYAADMNNGLWKLRFTR